MGEPKEILMEILTQSADLNYPPAQVDLWVLCRNKKEFSKGLPYLQKAINNNFIPAYVEMGYLYHYGIGGVRINYYEAKRMYEKAVVEGHPLAQNNLGVLYHNFKISAPSGYSSNQMAYYWYNLSAEQRSAKTETWEVRDVLGPNGTFLLFFEGDVLTRIIY